MIGQIKNLRVQIDGLATLVKELNPRDIGINSLDWRAYHTWETLMSYDSLLLAKAWLGKILEELGNPTPYQSDGNRHSKKDIEPTADRFKVPELIQVGDNKVFTELNHIEKVDWLRQEVKKLVSTISNLSFSPAGENNISTYPLANYRWEVIKYLSEARFYLGFELGRIKEQSNV